jgi:hypothetical protein
MYANGAHVLKSTHILYNAHNHSEKCSRKNNVGEIIHVLITH